MELGKVILNLLELSSHFDSKCKEVDLPPTIVNKIETHQQNS